MTTNPKLIKESDVRETHISDHHLVYSVLKLKVSNPPPSCVNTRSYKNYVADSFQADLTQTPWYENTSISDANEMLNNFNNRFMEVLDRHAPIKNIKIKHRQCSFVNKETKYLMRTRDTLFKLARRTEMPQDWEKYRLHRELVKTRLREAEKEYVNVNLKNCQKNSSMWKVIKKCIPRKDISQHVYTRDLKEVVHEFNSFFSSVGNTATEKTVSLAIEHNLPLQALVSTQQVPGSNKFCFHPVTRKEIHKIVMSFPSNKAPGHDKVSMGIFKDDLPCILPSLTDIINCSLLSSVFPSYLSRGAGGRNT